ncbi:AP2/ERF and B3 domain-containing transcription factor [Raphanus sativus]|uniref:AP2/ERF and B3 domain-containing transcription factor At1g51120 n=1 Tax=Raphanus sativus TaxID=3726 RepID=A0A6J0NZY3_RAPSA|nr:AP2/ERF and B3 domain-containing transcription factor At1g51120 [Raphanus sativus]KAJ4917734.1 AP2/ERF and B3 domain-containing transcription factor [Raphanus sativus]
MNSPNEAKTKAETSGSSDYVLCLAKPMEQPHVSNTATTTRYKGVVLQPNGNWGAQIYTEHRRIWLGTFKSAAEAAASYDSACIKIRGIDANSHRNFPWCEITTHEPEFQASYTTEAVLNMIKDCSYQHKFREYLRRRSQMVDFTNINIVAAAASKQSRGGRGVQEPFSCTQLFSKELTPSDVGKLNRLVIPKKHAVKHLPFISGDQKEREEGEMGGALDDVEVVFYDRAMRQWKFRYCYWRSSQSFVFTRGWNGFVREKRLKEKDAIIFYHCDVPTSVKTLQGQSNSFLMIDVDYFTDKGSVAPKEVDKMVHNTSEEEEMKTETKSEVNTGGFMLFGVRIQ